MLNRKTYFIREHVGFMKLSDNYMITLNQEPSPVNSILLLAAGLAVDTIYKEK